MEMGEVYAMNFVYSGNFLAQAELSQFDRVRMVMGIHSQGFCWRLLPGETFQAPEAVLVYSDAGLGKMTKTFHDLYRNHLIRSKYLHQKRPILINNWEATYFDFDSEKLLAIARQAKESGIALVPEDRKREGVVLGMSLRENICMASHDQLSRLGHIQKRKKDALAQKYIRDLQIRPADADRQIKNFSGGNQQKGVIAKWLATSPKVMILDEPTRGIDVGAKVEIYNIINQLAADGTAVIVVSSELLELLGICDRILVVNNGRISGEFDREHFSQDAIMQASFDMGGMEHERV